MAVGDLVVKLDLDGRGFTSKISIASKDVEKFSRVVGRSSRVIEHQTGVVRTWNRRLRDTFIVLGLARAAIANVTAVLTAFPKAVADANGELERMKQLMIGLDDSTSDFAESAKNADETIDKLFEISSNSPFDIDAVTDSFVKMKAAGLDPLKGSLQGVLDAVAKFGGSNEQLKRASIAIQQMAGKGVISMEELRQQLGEAVPSAMHVMARATGMEMSKMVKVISEGRLEAESALVAFARQLQIETSGAAADMSRTWVGTLNRLKNAWTLFLKEIGDAGAFEVMRDALKDLVVILDDPAVRDFAITMGELMAQSIVGIRLAIEALIEFKEEVWIVVKLFAAFTVAKWIAPTTEGLIKARAAVAALSLSVKGLQASFISLRANAAMTTMFATYAGSATAATMATATLAGMLSKLRVGLLMLGRGLMSMLGPVGIIAAALTVAYEVYSRWNEEQERSIDLLKKNAGLFSEDDIDFLKERRNELARDIVETKRYVANREDFNGTLEELQTRHADAVRRGATTEAARLSETIRLIETGYKKIEDLQTEFTALSAKSAEAVGEATARKIATHNRALIREVEDGAQEFQKAYAKNIKAIKAKIGGRDDLTRDEQGVLINAEMLVEEKKLLEKSQDHIQKAIDKQLEIIEKGNLEEQELAAGSLEVLEGLRQKYVDLVERVDVKIFDNSSEGTALASFETMLLSLEKRLGAAKAKIVDGRTEFAKLEAVLNSDGFQKDVISPELIERAIDLANSLDDANRAAANFVKVERGTERVKSQIDKLNAAVQGLNDRAETIANPWIKMAGAAGAASQRVAGFKRQLQDLIDIAETDEQRSSLLELMDGLGGQETRANIAAATAGLKGLENAIKDYKESTLGAAAAADLAFNRGQDEVQQYMDKFGHLLGPEAQRIADEYVRILEEMRARAADEVVELAHTWRQETENMSGIWASGIEGMTDSMTDFIVDGKANFKGFLNEMTKMIVKFMLQKIVSDFLMRFLGGALGSTGTSGSFMGDISGGGPNATTAANGAVVGPRGASSLKRYARGGIARSPQLAIFGEGDMAEAYVPLPDGRTIPVTLKQDSSSSASGVGGDVQVNLINQSGGSLDAEAAQPRFDGERMIVDVVLKNLAKPSRLRDAVKGI